MRIRARIYLGILFDVEEAADAAAAAAAASAASFFCKYSSNLLSKSLALARFARRLISFSMKKHSSKSFFNWLHAPNHFPTQQPAKTDETLRRRCCDMAMLTYRTSAHCGTPQACLQSTAKTRRVPSAPLLWQRSGWSSYLAALRMRTEQRRMHGSLTHVRQLLQDATTDW